MVTRGLNQSVSPGLPAALAGKRSRHDWRQGCGRRASNLLSSCHAFEEVFQSQVLVSMCHLLLLFGHLELPCAGLAIQGGISGAVCVGQHGAALGEPGNTVCPALGFVQLQARKVAESGGGVTSSVSLWLIRGSADGVAAWQRCCVSSKPVTCAWPGTPGNPTTKSLLTWPA